MNKALILDIETSPILAWVWALKDQNIGLNQIKKDWHIMAWSAKWLGDSPKKIMYQETRTDNDKPILQVLWKLLNEADIVISQNGKAFDWPRIKARMLEHGIKPPKPFKHIDTYKESKGIGFTSHKLEYVTNRYNKRFKKLTHKAFQGMVLWTECLRGNPKAWAEMRRYNIHDVLSTEEYYEVIKPWISQTAPSVAVPIGKPHMCPYCESYRARSMGYRKTVTGKVRRYICLNCGRTSKESS